MRKITLFLVMLFSMSMFGTRYLVQTGDAGDASWRTAEAGEVLVDLTVKGMSLNEWYDIVSSGDEVWIAAGTYVLNDYIAVTLSNQSVYGGFLGTEITTDDREKELDGYPWDFVNETILDGNNSVQVLFAGNLFSNVLFDGMTMTKAYGSSAAAQYRNGVTLRNCKLINNVSTSNGGGVTLYNGGHVIDSYIAGNSAAIGGGVYSNIASNHVALISGCLIENNSASNPSHGGGGVRTQGVGAGTTDVINCIIRGNKGLAADGVTLIRGAAIAANAPNCNFNNCLIYNNEGASSIVALGGNFTNITFVNNVGQFWIATAGEPYTITNSIVWGNKTADDKNTGITSNTDNENVIVSNSAVYPGLNPTAYTQFDNIALQLANDSQENAKGPGFVAPTTFWGVPTNQEEMDEYLNADWSIKYTSGCLDLGKEVDHVTSDFFDVSRPQGSAYDIGAFELPYYEVAVVMSDGGTVNGASDDFTLSEPKGKPLTYTIVAGAGMHIASAKYNGVEVKDELDEGVYNASALNINSTLEVEFDLGTSVENVNNNKFTYYVIDNSVVLRNVANQEVNIFSISGSRVFNTQSQTSELAIPLTAGVYILKVDDKVQKIIVQ